MKKVAFAIEIVLVITSLLLGVDVWAQNESGGAKDKAQQSAGQQTQKNRPQQRAIPKGQPTPPPAVTQDASPQSNAQPAVPAVPRPAKETKAPVPAPVVKGRQLRNSAPQETSKEELKLRQLAAVVEDLKNRVTALRYKLNLMKEVLVEEQSAVGGAKLVIQHVNEMGGSFRIVRLRYFLNGQLLQSYNAVNSKDKAILSRHVINIPVGLVSPGNMKLKVFITYQGNGYGIFKYVQNWTWEVSAEYTFSVRGGKAYTVQVIGYERGNFNTPLKDRPAIKFKMKVQPLVVTQGKSKKGKGSK